VPRRELRAATEVAHRHGRLRRLIGDSDVQGGADAGAPGSRPGLALLGPGTRGLERPIPECLEAGLAAAPGYVASSRSGGPPPPPRLRPRPPRAGRGASGGHDPARRIAPALACPCLEWLSRRVFYHREPPDAIGRAPRGHGRSKGTSRCLLFCPTRSLIVIS